jgi:hypothetical protein
VAFIREVQAEAIKNVGKYSTKTEMSRSWDIRGSNVRLNHVFELNGLRYDPYREEGSTDVRDAAECRKKRGVKRGASDKGYSKGKVMVLPVQKKVETREIGPARG